MESKETASPSYRCGGLLGGRRQPLNASHEVSNVVLLSKASFGTVGSVLGASERNPRHLYASNGSMSISDKDAAAGNVLLYD